jgi:DNA invertase Pin-like site-specific DNA recombinase
MTDAMKELYDIFKEESKDKWIKEGRRVGKKEGRREGIKEGVINTLLMLVKDGIISVEDAAKRANISVGTFQKYLNEKM